MNAQDDDFKVGDRVSVLRAARLPAVEEALGTGTVVDITEAVDGRRLLWVSGFHAARTAKVLRRISQ